MPPELAPSYIRLTRGHNPHLDAGKIDEAIRAHSVRMIHWRGMRCPVGLVDPHDLRQPHPDHQGCSNGQVYTRAGVVSALMVGNSKEKRPHVTGWLDSATAQITVPRTYDDGVDDVLLAPGDRLYWAEEEVFVTQSETIKASLGPIDRALRPIVRVQDLIDWTGQRLTQGVDFEVRDGRIAWTGRRPVYDPLTRAVPVFAIRYVMRPYFYVLHLTHEVRVGQEPDGAGGTRATRLPQSCIAMREYVYENQKRDPDAVGGDPARQQPGPADGGATTT